MSGDSSGGGFGVDELPFVSVIVPTHNRPHQLRACLEALAALDYPPDRFEVIVVDDASEVTPAAEIDRVAGRLDVTLLTQPRGGPATARNRGAAHASGAMLAFTDDDCRPLPKWLWALAAAYRAAPDAALGGKTVNELPQNPYSTTSHDITEIAYRWYNARPHQARFLASNNLAVPREAYLEFGGFDALAPIPAAEDREFCAGWLHEGRPLHYVPGAVVRHAHPMTLRTFWRQQFNYGRGAFLYQAVGAARGRPVPTIEWGLHLRIARYPLAKGRALPQVAALVGVSQAAVLVGYVSERRRRRRAGARLPSLPRLR